MLSKHSETGDDEGDGSEYGENTAGDGGFEYEDADADNDGAGEDYDGVETKSPMIDSNKEIIITNIPSSSSNSKDKEGHMYTSIRPSVSSSDIKVESKSQDSHNNKISEENTLQPSRKKSSTNNSGADLGAGNGNNNNNNADNDHALSDSSTSSSTIYYPIGIIFLVVVFFIVRFIRNRRQTSSIPSSDTYMRVPLNETCVKDIESGGRNNTKLQTADVEDDDNDDDPSSWDEWENSSFKTDSKPHDQKLNKNEVSITSLVNKNNDKTNQQQIDIIESITPTGTSLKSTEKCTSVTSVKNLFPYNANEIEIGSSGIQSTNAYANNTLNNYSTYSPSTSINNLNGSYLNTFSSNNIPTNGSFNAGNDSSSTSAVKPKSKKPTQQNEEIDLFASIGIAAKPTFHQNTATATNISPVRTLPTSFHSTTQLPPPKSNPPLSFEQPQPTVSKLHSLMDEMNNAPTATVTSNTNTAIKSSASSTAQIKSNWDDNDDLGDLDLDDD